jgi:hypothetical protein
MAVIDAACVGQQCVERMGCCTRVHALRLARAWSCSQTPRPAKVLTAIILLDVVGPLWPFLGSPL